MSNQCKVYGTMLSPEMAEIRLKENGCRMTAQRHAVLEILAGNRTHPTAEALVILVQAKLGYVSPATIYNTLEALEELGFIRRIDGLEQRAHFDPDTSDHQHIICRNCKWVWDIESPPPLADLPLGFIIEDVLIQGVCKQCSSNLE